MRNRLIIILLLAGIITGLSFVMEPTSPASAVKALYLAQVDSFTVEAKLLQKLAASSDEKRLKAQFLKTRLAYKKIEIFVEYFFPFYAAKLNGPPIPFYEEIEPEKGAQEPMGMQVIESYLYPKFHQNNRQHLILQVNELARYAIELPGIQESEAFNDTNIFDAIMEQLFRVTALGITGFDANLSGNSLAECNIGLAELELVLKNYSNSLQEKMPESYLQLTSLLAAATTNLAQASSFNKFNRLGFTRRYLNPLAKILGEYKIRKGYIDNAAGLYYSAVIKRNSLFDELAFNPFRFIDDYSISPFKISLGRQLFFEKNLSSNKQRSCASCHQPGLAFSDGLKTSMALDGHSPLPRNAPGLWNTALQRNLFLDGRSRTLEEQIMAVLNNGAEMHGSAIETAKNIINSNAYHQAYLQAYPNAKPGDAAINICNAIASFERTLISLNSRFDKYMRGEEVLTAGEQNGYNLFMGKAKCGTCHFTPLFSGAKPPRYYFMENEVIGVPAANKKQNARLSPDSGKYMQTGLPMHLFAFKTPGLRNVALTAPYMHNGVFSSLEEVVDFYNDGGGKGLGIAPFNQTLPFDRLNLDKKEKRDLVLFMKSLTDTSTDYRVF